MYLFPWIVLGCYFIFSIRDKEDSEATFFHYAFDIKRVNEEESDVIPGILVCMCIILITPLILIYRVLKGIFRNYYIK